MTKFSKGQIAVLVTAAVPMAATGITGAVATYSNMSRALGENHQTSALGMVAVGEGVTLVCALISLAVTLMGQHTPGPVRLGLWLVPIGASIAGLLLAKTDDDTVLMAVTPMAMTGAGEGIAFVARRVVAYSSGIDIEQQRRSGLMLWHANRANNGRGLGRQISKMAVWRLTKTFAATDTQLSVQLGEVQRFHIRQGADENLAAVLTGSSQTPGGATALKALKPPQSAPQLPPAPTAPAKYAKLLEAPYRPATDSLAGGTPVPQPTPAPTPAPTAEAVDYADEYWTGDDESGSSVGDDAPTLLSVADVAVMKNVKAATVRGWKHKGRLDAVMVDGRPYFRAEDVANLDV